LKSKPARKISSQSASCCVLAWLTLQLEDGGDMFLRNFGGFSTYYTALAYGRISSARRGFIAR
jgi:hypothetical protein